MPRMIQAGGYGKDAVTFPVYNTNEVNRRVLASQVVDYDLQGALDYDSFIQDLDGHGMAGLDVVNQTRLGRKPSEVITFTAPGAVKMSTVYMVLGLSVLAVAGGIAFWAYSKKKGR